MATSNRNVAGCFLWKADTVFTESAMKDVSQASPETINIVPRRKAASKRVSTPAGAGKDIPCHYVKCCPAFGQRTVT